MATGRNGFEEKSPRNVLDERAVDGCFQALAALLFVVSIIDSGGVNPFIDLVILTFFEAKTYRQIQEERKAASVVEDAQRAIEGRTADAQDSGH